MCSTNAPSAQQQKSWDCGGCVCAAYNGGLHKETLETSMFFYDFELAFGLAFMYNVPKDMYVEAVYHIMRIMW